MQTATSIIASREPNGLQFVQQRVTVQANAWHRDFGILWHGSGTVTRRLAGPICGGQSPKETSLGTVAVSANVASASGGHEISARLSFGDRCRDRRQRMK